MSALLEVAYALENALYALLVSASKPGGKLGASSQPSPVAIVERVAPPEQRLYPSVAVQFRRYDEAPSGTHRETVAAYYDIAVAVQQPYYASKPNTIAAGRAALRPFIEDGRGNGILPLLRSQPALGNLCRRSKIVSLEETALVTGSATAGSIVAALIVFQCDYAVRV